jgi:hypothetical protein
MEVAAAAAEDAAASEALSAEGAPHAVPKSISRAQAPELYRRFFMIPRASVSGMVEFRVSP